MEYQRLLLPQQVVLYPVLSANTFFSIRYKGVIPPRKMDPLAQCVGCVGERGTAVVLRTELKGSPVLTVTSWPVSGQTLKTISLFLVSMSTSDK